MQVITMTNEEREAEFKEFYGEFLHLYYHTDLHIKDILAEIGLTENASIHRRIKRQIRKDGEVDGRKRRYMIDNGEWL